MHPPEHFATERLRLRPVERGDAAVLFEAYASDPQATRYLSWRTHDTPAQTAEFLAGAEQRWRDGTEYIWALVSRAEQQAIGALGAAASPHGIEIGYVLGRDWWGRGLMSEALAAVMGWLCDQPDVHRVWAYCAVGHRRSAAVLERAGMRFEGTLRRWVVLPNLDAAPQDADVYSWVRGEARPGPVGREHVQPRRPMTG
jgi:ribosomal-protein-alanine N-acetyltransferase